MHLVIESVRFPLFGRGECLEIHFKRHGFCGQLFLVSTILFAHGKASMNLDIVIFARSIPIAAPLAVRRLDFFAD